MFGVISGTGTDEINADVSFYIDMVLLTTDAPSNSNRSGSNLTIDCLLSGNPSILWRLELLHDSLDSFFWTLMPSPSPFSPYVLSFDLSGSTYRSMWAGLASSFSSTSNPPASPSGAL